MKVALLSDIHSNLEAFQAVQASLAAYQADEIIFLGDIVGYGADPNDCIALLRNLADCSIAGNHDFAAVGKTAIQYFNPPAKEAIVWTQKKLSRENARFLSSLPLHAVRHGFFCVHSTPMHPPASVSTILPGRYALSATPTIRPSSLRAAAGNVQQQGTLPLPWKMITAIL
jgi:hypothetical protein